jgi:hypothetical protein
MGEIMRLTANRIAIVMCLYFVMLTLAYAIQTPIFEAPDEGAHFLYSHNLLQTGELPILEDHDIVFASHAVQRHHPSTVLSDRGRFNLLDFAY